jgi:hypothetical protein
MSSDQKPQRTETAHASNASVLSFGSESTLTASSTTPLRKSSRKPKDYEAALGVLQSRYGMGGDIPSPKKEPSTKLPGREQPADHEGAGGSLSAPPTSSFTTIGGSPPSFLKQTISRSLEGSSNSGQGKKKYSLFRLFQGV